jgi:hypothetical protein
MKFINFLYTCIYFREPAGMWITNPHTYVRNNVAAGGEGFGIWVLFPLEPLPPSRQYNLMSPYEARKTNLLEYTNNVAHSNIGVCLNP